MQRKTWYFTIITATYIFSNCVFSERTCMLISVGQCWCRNQFRCKIVDQCKEILCILQLSLLLTYFPIDESKEILGILQLSLLLTCFPIVFFQSVLACSSLSDNVDEEIHSEVRLLANAKKYLVFYNYHCYVHVFQLCIFRAYPHTHLCRTMLMKTSIQK